ncbi:MAG: hypothetical protein ACT4QC_14720 [Planctomycetaceae bacterium]
MSFAQTPDRLQLPQSLQQQLYEFRRRVWRIKMIEALCGAAFATLVAFLALFAFDRAGETPAWARLALFIVTLCGAALVPAALHRWVWRHRKLDQLARLLARRHPLVGDQLLGIIELVRDDAEQSRSPALCAAAIGQVAEDAQGRDLSDGVPRPRHRLWAGLVAFALVPAAVLFAMFPQAASNAWGRLIAPWRASPRYTFTAIEPLPESLVVAHGEPFTLLARLASHTAWRPETGRAELPGQAPLAVELRDGAYEFQFPAQIEPGEVQLRIGDWRGRVSLSPMLRPELASVVADVTLPEYLGRSGPEHKDVRGGVVSLVNGSVATFRAAAGRDLAQAQVNGESVAPQGASIASAPLTVSGPAQVEFRWQDRFGLSGREPFALAVQGRDDEPPAVVCEGLPRQKVVLDSEILTFNVRAHDDFGVKQVGIEWAGLADPTVAKPARGESILAAGAPEQAALEAAGTFSAQSLSIEPQPVGVRVFVEDYLPGRERVYSPMHVLYVLTAEQHAIWLTDQLSKWHRQSLEVRDRELQLYETNRQLRALSPEELDEPETRHRLDAQASAERANGRRLSNLVGTGEGLVKQAMRNPQFGVGHLEKWAEMLQILKDISANRMPSVADLLKQAAQAPAAAANPSSKQTAMAGQVRAAGSPKPSAEKADEKPKPAVPRVADIESSQQPPDKNAKDPPPPGNKKPNERLTLVGTTLVGNGKTPDKKPAPAEQKVDEAVKQQQDLLAEFDKIADELNRVLAELEGSTLVKRLKAASRVQYKIGGRLGDQLGATFGVQLAQVGLKPAQVLAELSEQEAKSSHTVSLIMDDMQAYFERRRFVRFKNVLDEMRQQDVIGSLRQLGDDLRKENGISIAQADYWSDTLDRWAEDLVDAGCCGQCPGCKSKGSLPPSIVLEVLLILEGEVNLREETRVAEQARPAIETKDYGIRADGLSKTQTALEQRVVKVIERIRELPDAETDFACELGLLGRVTLVMNEASGILATPNTGSPAIAAETEAIELLLQSKRINPKGGGGGSGSTPGGGGGGDTQDSALALLGSGVNNKEVREDRGVPQSSGDAGTSLPAEFRAGLDQYFNRLERGAGGD